MDKDKEKEVPATAGAKRRASIFRIPTFALERTDTMIRIGKLKLRGKTDDLPQYVSLPLVGWGIGN